jgi:hypothetical protein
VDRFLKYFQLVKVDEAQRIVYGVVTAEREDRDGEICDYASTKPEYEKVNREMGKASDGENIMPLREMHQLHAVGAGKSIDFDDATKTIRMGFKVVEDSTWKKVLEKVLLGFSQGGRYVRKWTQDKKQYYTAEPTEVSLVDSPCLPGAQIEYVKADGSIEKITAELRKEVKYLVPDGKHLPYTDADGKPNHRLMGAAWAALHGGYRGNKYEGPNRDAALAHLRSIYHSEGMEPPSEKSAKTILSMFGEFDGFYERWLDSGLNTDLEKISEIVDGLVRQLSTEGGQMNKEQIAKCAAALGITVEEFTKQYVEGDALEKGKKGLAALHSHLKKALSHHTSMVAHHEKIGAMHKAHADHHATMADHLENCMKAHGACMDGEEADKVLAPLLAKLAGGPEELVLIGKTADGVEVFRKKGTADVKLEGLTTAPAAGLKAEDVQKMVDAALAKQKEEFEKKLAPENGGTRGARLTLIDRDGKEVRKAENAADARNPMAVS